jgi:hypothetical protein
MKNPKNNEQFNLFLKSQGMDIKKFQYICKDSESYKVRNLITGVIGYIRY